jgi:hypothetical protein
LQYEWGYNKLPVNPGAQIQEKSVSPEIQVPPFLQAGGSFFTLSAASQYDILSSQYFPEKIE